MSYTYQLTDEQLAEVKAAKREVREGKIATDAEIEEVWQRFGLKPKKRTQPR